MIVVAALLVGCAAPTTLSDAERARVIHDLDGRRGFLRSSCLVATIEGEPRLRLLSPYPIEDFDPAERSAMHVAAAPPEKILPSGTPVRVVRVEFATAVIEARREPRNPRRSPWMYLKVEGEPADRTFVVVLPVALASEEDASAAAEQAVAWDSLEPALASYLEPVRRAIAEKRVTPGMDTAAVQMAWGWPERREIVLREAGREETWVYSGGKRRVFFGGGRVSRTEP